jgi:hypothetical protein
MPSDADGKEQREGGVMDLTRHEKDQLWQIGNGVYGNGRNPYWWGEKTMPKLAAKGLVEPHPGDPRGWRITDAGRQERERQFPGR